MSTYLSTIEIHKETMRFSAGHTIFFSATERAPLHGHRYHVALSLTTLVEDNGMKFDYRYYEKMILTLCQQLNQTFLMPQNSPHVQYSEDEDYYYFTFNHKKMPFLKEDITLMPLTNITVEELSRWFVQELTKEKQSLQRHHIQKIVVRVFSGPGLSSSHEWHKS